ncbi:MAG: Gfo/Idh/MocA family oxidoreductase, partial [Anaerolineae bacterium]|nr:Gfo/Idh/MocA family oxidoreductase [Anaerolineae bacterium]
IPALQQTASGALVAVASRNIDNARRFASAHGAKSIYGSYDDLLAAPDVDAVYIPLPNHLHKEWSIKAAKAGKHVMCEKPIGLNAADAEEIVAAFDGTGLKLAEAFQWRHHPQGQKVRDLVRAGAIGDLRLIDAGFSFMLDRAGDVRWEKDMGGGALYDVGCYPISLARYIAGAEPISVTAHAEWGDTGVDTLVVATLKFPDGVLAHINCSFALPLRRYYVINGSEGSLEVNGAYNPTGIPGQVIRRGEDRAIEETIDVGAFNSYVGLIEDFNRAVLDDRDPLFGGADAIKNMRVIDAIYAAARDGGTVAVG